MEQELTNSPQNSNQTQTNFSQASTPTSTQPAAVLSVEKQGASMGTKVLIAFLGLVAVSFGVLYGLSLLPGSSLQSVLPGTNNSDPQNMQSESAKQTMQATPAPVPTPIAIADIPTLSTSEIAEKGDGGVRFYIAEHDGKLYGYSRAEFLSDKIEMLAAGDFITFFEQMIREVGTASRSNQDSEYFMTKVAAINSLPEIPADTRILHKVTGHSVKELGNFTSRITSRNISFSVSPSQNTMFYAVDMGGYPVNADGSSPNIAGTYSSEVWFIKRTSTGFVQYLVPKPFAYPNEVGYLLYPIFNEDESAFMVKALPCVDCSPGVQESFVYRLNDDYSFEIIRLGETIEFEWMNNTRFKYKPFVSRECAPEEESPVGCFVDPDELEFVEGEI